MKRGRTEDSNQNDREEDYDQEDDDLDGEMGSCESCKKRKVRCDRIKPSCGWCTKNSGNCVYKAKRKPGLKPGYGKSMLDRLYKIESNLSDQGDSLLRLNSDVASQSIVLKKFEDELMKVPNNTIRLNKLEAHLSSQANTILELSKQLDFFRNQHNSPGLSPHSTQIHIKSSPKVSLPRTPANELSIIGSNGNNNNNDNNDNHSPSTNVTITTPLPPKELLRELVDLYFQRIHPCYPFLHPIKTSSLLHDIISQTPETPGSIRTPSASTQPKEYPLILYSIIAVTVRFVPQFKLNEFDKERYYRTCKETVMLKSFAITDLDCLQALVVLAIDLVGISNGPETWSIIPLICSAATHLGLSREPITNSFSSSENESISAQSADILPPAENWQDLESRRRLFWVIYSLDRFSSVATAFSFKLNSLEIDRLLPIREDLWTDVSLNDHSGLKTRWLKTPIRKDYSINYPLNIDGFGYMMENLQLLSSIHEFLKKPVSIYSLQDVLEWQVSFRHLDSDLDSWYKSLPSHLTVDTINANNLKNPLNPMIIMLQSTYQTTVIRLNSAAGYSCLKSDFFSNSPSAAKRCLTAVANVVSLAKHVIVFGLGQYVGPHYAWALWVSARLLVVDCVTNYKSFPEDLEVLLTGLRKLGRVWKVAARYYGLLTMIIDEQLSLRSRGSDSVSRDDTNVDSNGENERKGSSAQIFTDMRRNAYALDFLLSKQKKEKKELAEERKKTRTGSINDNESIKSDDQMDQESIISSLDLPELMDGSNMNDIFDWFNWPRQTGQMGEKTPLQHSVGEYKNILSREDQFGFYDGLDGKRNERPDWMSM